MLRGASFAFRKSVFRTRDRRNFGAAFALSSVLVPYCFGAVVGGIASGRVPAGGKAGDPWDSWVNPTSVTVGLLAVALDAYLAAFFLVRDAGRLSDEAMVAYFRRRATGAAVVAGVVSLAGIFVLSNDAEYLFDGLTSRALPLVILSVAFGLGALVLLTRRARRGARLAAVGAVASVVLAWGVAQWDYLLPESLTVSDAGGALRDHHGGAGRHRARSAARRTGLRAAVRPRPEGPAARGEHAGARWIAGPETGMSTGRRSVPGEASSTGGDARPAARDDVRTVATDQHYDVIVIGTGAGGGTLAHRLAPSGKRVLILERGDYLPRERDNWDSTAVFVTGKYRAPEFWYDAHGHEFPPEVNYYVGGNTKFYGAALFRLRPEDFGEIQHHGGLSPAWPIEYAELEPFYTQAEHLYRVRGRHGEDPTEGAASAQYAHPPVEHEPRIQQLSDDMEKQGLHPFHLPIGVDLTQDADGRATREQRLHPV